MAIELVDCGHFVSLSNASTSCYVTVGVVDAATANLISMELAQEWDRSVCCVEPAWCVCEVYSQLDAVMYAMQCKTPTV